MVRQLLTGLWVVLALFSAASGRLNACSCAPAKGPCQTAWADAVFVGTVTANVPLTEPDVTGSRRVTLVLREAFTGVEGRLVTVRTGSNQADCGFNFVVGRTYLVYAHQHPLTGTLLTGICSRTALADHVAGELRSLRRTPDPVLSEPGLVYGRAMRSDFQSATTPRINEPFAGARIRLTGESGAWHTETLADGRYELRVPPGRYRMTVHVGEGLYSLPDARTGRVVRVTEPKACAPLDISVRSNGRLRGRVVDSQGNGLPFLTVDLTDRTAGSVIVRFPAARTITDGDGTFEFERVEPGQYALGLTMRRYPQRGGPDYAIVLKPETAIEIGLEAAVDIGTVRLQDDVDIRLVTGRVADESGAPTPNVEVRVTTPGPGFGVVSEPVVTDAHGRFQISVIGGRTHVLVAEDPTDAGDRLTLRTARSATFDAAATQGPFALVLKGP